MPVAPSDLDVDVRRQDRDPQGWPAGGGEMGAIMRSTDWSKTQLGPAEDWPKSLRTMLGVILGSRFPMLLWWGPDLLHLYNDGYRTILRDKHPASLAAPAAQVWAEIWDVVRPLTQSVWEGGPATWTEDLQLFINSGGMAEETYFTFSYSPVPGDDGRIGGLLNTVQETTVKVQSERQIRMLHDLAARVADAKSEGEAYHIVAEVLSANELDLPFVLLYVLNEQSDGARLVGVSGWKGYADTSAARWPITEVLRSSREVVIDDLSARFGSMPVGRWNVRPERAILLPLFLAGRSAPYAMLVAGISPHRAFDDRYRRFFRATADQVMTVIANARAYETETKRAEALAQIDRAKTAFFSNVSHEFRTPLTLMLGPLEEELAERDSPLPPARRLRLDTAHRNSLRLLKLVNTLLDFSRIEAGRVEANYEPTDLAAYTAELASVFRSAIEKANLTLAVSCPPLPEPIYVDREMWEKTVLNLLSNAFKHTFEGGIQVILRWGGDHAELSVADSGIGIPEAELPRLFERFHRVKGAKSRTHEGTGIGLALVQELVSLHGGTVGVESREGKGTTFTVTVKSGCAHLPAERVGAGRILASTATRTTAYVEEALRWLPDASPTQTPKGTQDYVLVADDNADLRDYVASLLRPYYRVEAVADGALALEAVHKQKPDLIVSDVMMPNLDGLGLLRKLRGDTRTQTIPVILLSARAGEESSIEGLHSGADDYLAKPFSAQELLARVRTHLELARVRREWANQLEQANKELEAFSYSVSHDLRAPLRAIDGFSKVLLDEYAEKLDERACHYLRRVRTGSQKMSELIDDLLNLSRVSRAALRKELTNLTVLARDVVAELQNREPARKVGIEIADGLSAWGDAHLITIVLVNLLGNAWKYTAKRPEGHIAFGQDRKGNETVFYVRDNGAGFDMAHADKLFAPFQRLHRDSEFEGTGIGLATVQRIISRHGGRIWAEAAVDQGATFYFTLGQS